MNSGLNQLVDDVGKAVVSIDWFKVYAGSSAVALIAGVAQRFIPAVGRSIGTRKLVRSAYVAGCLAGGVSGLILAANVSAKPSSGAAMGVFGAAWVVATWLLWSTQYRNNADRRRWWIDRLLLLTLAVIVTRLYLGMTALLGVHHVVAYRIIAWSCLLPNTIVLWILARRYIARRAKPTPGRVEAEERP